MQSNNFPVGPFTDYSYNPILTPIGGFQSKGIFNPTVIKEGENFYMLYRAECNDGLTGRIGLAQSQDGFHFTCHSKPVVSPEEDFDKGGCEDPRVVKFEDTYFLTYVGNSRMYHVSNICLATSKDLLHWEKHGPVLQPKKGTWNSGQLKAGVIVPEKIKGKYVMYFMGEEKPWLTAIGIAFSDDLFYWYEPEEGPIVSPRENHFDCKGVEPGATPLLINKGILLIYNAWGEDSIYKPGGLLFSKEEPTKILARTENPLLIPSRDYGKELGAANHIVAEGLVKHKDKWLLYYGAADRFTCLAIYEERR